MRALILSLFLTAATASAQAPEPSGEERITFTRAQLDGIQKELEVIVKCREKAANLAVKREAGIRSSAALARADADGLRGDLNAANEYAKESRAAAERIAGIATDLFGRCTARYLGVAEAAQRADSEARELRQGWPK